MEKLINFVMDLLTNITLSCALLYTIFVLAPKLWNYLTTDNDKGRLVVIKNILVGLYLYL